MCVLPNSWILAVCTNILLLFWSVTKNWGLGVDIHHTEGTSWVHFSFTVEMMWREYVKIGLLFTKLAAEATQAVCLGLYGSLALERWERSKGK